MNILVVDDQEKTRSIIASTLHNWGYAVITAPDGRAALQYLVGDLNSVDIMITDGNMPHMNGMELARRTRELTKNSSYIYIILLTIKTDMADFVTGFTEGKMDDYLIKPFSTAQFRLRLEVGARLVRSERNLRCYNADLEAQVRRQTETLKNTQDEVLSRLFTALECRDEETALHVRRIGIMSACLGRMLGWDAARRDLLEAAAPLHDIGKIGLSDSLLRKTGTLAPEEQEQVRQHTVIGARILAGSHDPVIRTAERIALSHHENWDGSGYPQGLRGNKIPLEAQLVSIVDSYDVMLSDRAYRKGLPEREVLRYIREQSGYKFSPALARLFLGRLDEIKAQCSRDVAQFFTRR